MLAPHTIVAPTPEALAASRGALLTRLALPRFRDVVMKWPLLFIGAAVALVAARSWPALDEAGYFIALWVAVELFAYQARYQLNDLRDRQTDAAHPEGLRRGRLSFPWTRWRAVAVWTSVVVRIVLALTVILIVLDGSARKAGLIFLVLFVPVSLAYELAREQVRRNAVVPGAPDALKLGLPVLVCVPLGYGLRVSTGYLAMADEAPSLVLVTLLTVMTLAVYTGSVLLAWTLESTSFLARDRVGAPAAGLGQRAHLLLLATHSGMLSADVPARPDSAPPEQIVVARDRPARSPLDLRVWDVAGMLAIGAAYAVAAVGSSADGWSITAMSLAALVAVCAPSLLHARYSAGPGTWDSRPSWLAHGALRILVATEILALVVAALVVTAHEPQHARLLWVPAFALFQVGAMRASSYRRGFGPLSVVKRPLQFARGLA